MENKVGGEAVAAIEKPKRMGHKGKPIGTPSKYKPEYCDLVRNWFLKETADKTLYKVTTDSKGRRIEVPRLLPTFVRFCKLPEVPFSFMSLKRWSGKAQGTKGIPEFMAACEECEHMRTDMAMQLSIRGSHNPIASIFALKNMSGWKDQNKLEAPQEQPVEYDRQRIITAIIEAYKIGKKETKEPVVLEAANARPDNIPAA